VKVVSRLGFLGPQGSFTEVAAREYEHQVGEFIPYNDIKSLVLGVVNDDIDRAVVPIENSIQGGVTLTLDLLAEFELNIVGEVVVVIEQSLVAKKKMDLAEIRHVISHPQALAQCRAFLEENLINYETHISNSTSEAIQQLTTLDESWVAIGNSRAVDHYDLEVLAQGIQDNRDNCTRFVVLSKQEGVKSQNDKTSIICSVVEDHPGFLYDILHEFAIRGINLTKIESRPAKRMLGEYIFFIDFEGHYLDSRVKEALELVRYKSSWYKLLGSYKKAVNNVKL